MKINRFDIKRLNSGEFKSFLKKLNRIELNEVSSYIHFQKNKANLVWENLKGRFHKDDILEKDALLDQLYWSNKERILIEEGTRRINS